MYFMGERGDAMFVDREDELPYAADADTPFLSALQYAWDQSFQRSQAVIVLCGSHVRTMQTLLSMQSPLFGQSRSTVAIT